MISTPLRWKSALVLLFLLPLSACSPLHAVNLVSPNSAEQRISHHFDEERGLELDIYLPAQAQRPAPVVVFFYGGGWRSGSRGEYQFVGHRLAKLGLVAVIPDYRLYPDVQFPAFVQDGARAVRWVQENIRDFAGDPDRIFLAGHSAGAHIASLLHFDERYLQAEGDEAPHCGMVGISGPYDFAPLLGPTLNAIFPAATQGDSQPVDFVDGSEGPVLLLHGLEDKTVKPRNSARLANAATEAGGQASYIIYSERAHTGTLLSLAPIFDRLSPVPKDLSDFVHNTMCSE